jgi:hypothetical protein
MLAHAQSQEVSYFATPEGKFQPSSTPSPPRGPLVDQYQRELNMEFQVGV